MKQITSLFILLGMLCGHSTAAEAPAGKQRSLLSADKNKDGKLTPDEVSPALWKRLAAFDANGDGALSAEELAAADKKGGEGRKPGGATAAFEVRQFKAENGRALEYSLFVPPKIEPGAKLPLVLCLHGAGGGTDAARVLATPARQAVHPCFVMAPTVGERGNRWVDSAFREGKGRSVLPELMGALDAALRELPVDPDRVYLTGQSMGGVGTWGAIAAHPERFAAAVPVCGMWPPEDADKMKRVPVWAFHGDKDNAVPVEGSRKMIAALKAAGASPRYTEFPGVGHGSWEPAYATDAMWDWMFQQRRSAP